MPTWRIPVVGWGNQIVVKALVWEANGYEHVTSQQKVFAEIETEEQQKLENKEHWTIYAEHDSDASACSMHKH